MEMMVEWIGIAHAARITSGSVIFTTRFFSLLLLFNFSDSSVLSFSVCLQWWKQTKIIKSHNIFCFFFYLSEAWHGVRTMARWLTFSSGNFEWNRSTVSFKLCRGFARANHQARMNVHIWWYKTEKKMLENEDEMRVFMMVSDKGRRERHTCTRWWYYTHRNTHSHTNEEIKLIITFFLQISQTKTINGVWIWVFRIWFILRRRHTHIQWAIACYESRTCATLYAQSRRAREKTNVFFSSNFPMAFFVAFASRLKPITWL